jgi:membrane protease YdiL (CAAX protease family)
MNSGRKVVGRWIFGPDGRIRAGWRILLCLLLTSAVLAPTMMGIRALLGGLPRIYGPLILAPVAMFTVFICRRYLDKRSLLSLGLKLDRATLLDGLFGFTLSGLMVAGVFLLDWAAGLIQLQGTGSLASALPSLAFELLTTGVAVAFWEELMFRGYILQNMRDGLGLRWAVVISVVLYGVVHMANPGANVLSGVLISVIGILRIYGWLSTRQLWLSMGMHAGWNFFQGPVFGFGVSGHQSVSFVHHELTGPTWLTGGDFGPEAGIVCLPFIALGFLSMYLWTRARQQGGSEAETGSAGDPGECLD